VGPGREREREGPFDVVLVGRNSVDADTGQVGPELAELLGLPFATGVRELALEGTTLHLRCEHDDGWVQARVELPAVLSVAERLIDPCKVEPDGRGTVEAELIRAVTAADLGPGPWGAAGSPTVVGPVRLHRVARDRTVLDGLVEDQVRAAVELLARRGALDRAPDDDVDTARVPAGSPSGGPAVAVAVAVEPDRPHATREMLGASAEIAASIGGHVVALVAAITSSSPVQMATVRAGVLPSLTPRSRRARVEQLDAGASSRTQVIARTRDDDLDALAEAAVVVGVGTGVAPDEYPALQPLLTLLDAELGATRKVTDRGWLPRARQIGITGRAISPRLYVALGVSGKFNHMVGVRAADTVLSVNRARDALVHDSCDIGIVAEVREAVPLLVAEIEQIRATA
jgi:electron transfer flavoprotein alpha subunit